MLNEAEIKDKLVEYHDKCVNMFELCHKLGYTNISGATYKYVKTLASDMGLELVFSYARSYRKRKANKISLQDILVEHSSYKPISRLKKRLVREGLKEHRCEMCGRTTWNEKQIPLQLHHVNGNPTDNRLHNLKLLCPNCHAQTDNYCGKNSHKDLDITSSQIIENYKEPPSFEECHPSKEQLIDDFRLLKSFKKIGEKYKVTDKSIRKWFSYYKLPRYTSDVKKMLGI